MKNVAVVGFGFMGMTHTMNVLRNKELNLVAIVDKDMETARKNLQSGSGNFSTETIREEDLSNVRIYTDFDECLKKEPLDACVISVHTDLHYELTRMALEGGIHVFLEKPFCLDITEGEELIKIKEERGLLLMVGQVVRFMPAYLKLKEWIDTGELGNLKFLSFKRFSGVPGWGQWKEKQARFGSSGGALFDLVIHDIDFAQWVFGRADRLDSFCLPGRLSDHDYVNATWEYITPGYRIQIEGGNLFHSAFPFHAGFAARFEKASIRYPGKDPLHISLVDDNDIKEILAGDPNEGFSAEINYFTDCLLSGKYPLQCTPESALETIRICYSHIQKSG